MTKKLKETMIYFLDEPPIKYQRYKVPFKVKAIQSNRPNSIECKCFLLISLMINKVAQIMDISVVEGHIPVVFHLFLKCLKNELETLKPVRGLFFQKSYACENGCV